MVGPYLIFLARQEDDTNTCLKTKKNILVELWQLKSGLVTLVELRLLDSVAGRKTMSHCEFINPPLEKSLLQARDQHVKLDFYRKTR
jgi:hypothetical protein